MGESRADAGAPLEGCLRRTLAAPPSVHCAKMNRDASVESEVPKIKERMKTATRQGVRPKAYLLVRCGRATQHDGCFRRQLSSEFLTQYTRHNAHFRLAFDGLWDDILPQRKADPCPALAEQRSNGSQHQSKRGRPRATGHADPGRFRNQASVARLGPERRQGGAPDLAELGWLRYWRVAASDRRSGAGRGHGACAECPGDD